MSIRNRRGYTFICCILLLFTIILFAGCAGIPLQARENVTSSSPSGNDSIATGDALNNSSVHGNTTGSPDLIQDDPTISLTLDRDWRAFRVTNLDMTTRYLTLDLSKSDDINYLRYSLIPDTTDNISAIRSDLETLHPVTSDQVNDTKTLIMMTNYTILKYETLSQMLHATQYANMRDPTKLKAEIRSARLSVMDALDIVNSAELTAYPSEYRDQIAADKRELDDMMSQIDAYTRSVYQVQTN